MSSSKPKITLKRAYDDPEPGDGKRILVDRLWPRGLSKEHAHIDEWLKDIAPSNDLRKWYAHDPAKFAEFRHRYQQELQASEARETLQKLRDLAKKEPVTLVFSAHDTEHSNAVVLRDVLQHS